MRRIICGLIFSALLAFGVEVPGGTFDGVEAAASGGWKLTGGVGAIENGAASVTGDGKTDSAWLSGPLKLVPNAPYLISFRTRSEGATGGCGVSGLVNSNVDLPNFQGEWRNISYIVTAPKWADKGVQLRFGQWMVKGKVFFDDIHVDAVIPIYGGGKGITLGEGERISVDGYLFEHPFNGTGRSHARPLYSCGTGYNSNRWTFGKDSEVIYRHQVGGRRQLSGAISVSVHYHVSGVLVVEVSRDGVQWQEAGRLDKVGMLKAKMPASLFPADVVFVRLRSLSEHKTNSAKSDPGSFQVNGYKYSASLDSAPVEVRGTSAYVQIESMDPSVDVNILSPGEHIPGGKNTVEAEVTSRVGKTLNLVPSVEIEMKGKSQKFVGASSTLAAGKKCQISIPYEVAGVGDGVMRIVLGQDLSFAASLPFVVPAYFTNEYGKLLTKQEGTGSLWYASSGWKIPRGRVLPVVRDKAVRLSACRGETEAVQVVLRPTRAMKGVQVEVTSLRSSGGAVIPASCVEPLRVMYININQKTDNIGLVGLWPDPLPPWDTPAELPANLNQPAWIRCKVPENAPAGIYTGMVTFRDADGTAISTRLQLEVFDFKMPQTMSCESCFGFSPSTVWRYQNITEPEQRRMVLEKYWKSFAEHRITPADIAPLDAFGVRLDGLQSDWKGGKRVSDPDASGKTALCICDKSETNNVAATCTVSFPVPKKGFTLSFKSRTLKDEDNFLVTFTTLDANGKWLSGRNRDILVQGSTRWRDSQLQVNDFSEQAVKCNLILRATPWSEEGTYIGTTWIDELKLIDNDTGKLLLDEPFDPVDLSKLKPVFDWTRWDAEVQRVIDTFHFNTLRIHLQGLGSGTYHSRNEPSFFGYGENTPEYQLLHPAYLAGINEHLREKGWLGMSYVYWFDEPSPKDYDFVMNGFAKIRKSAPGIRRMLTEQVEPELLGGPNLWCPVTPNLPKEDVPPRKKEGEQFWWYVCTGPKAPYATLFIDHPGVELRTWLWQTWDYGVQGILVWQTNYWTSGTAYPNSKQDPYVDTMSWVSGYSTPIGTKSPWGNGDGRFIYPPLAAAQSGYQKTVLDGPVDSIRWEMLRDGIEDYEYFAILKRRLTEKGTRLTPARRAEYEALLTVPQTITKSMTDFSTDPADMEAHRMRLARAIESLNAKTPKQQHRKASRPHGRGGFRRRGTGARP